jgi:hypothetical protein
MTTNTATLWARFVGVGNVNRDNARGKGNRAARRAGWYVRPTAGPLWDAEMRQLMASI